MNIGGPRRSTMRNCGRALLMIGTLVAFAGCGDDTHGLPAPPPPTGPDGGAPAATFTQVYTTVITNRCTPCHTTANGIGIQQGHLDMTTQAAAYANLVNVPAAGIACGGRGIRVVPGMPDSSIMYLKISLDDPTPCGGKMPLGGPPLTKAQDDLI